MPIIPHWSGYLGRNCIYLFLINFCPSVYEIDCMYLLAPPMFATDNILLHFLEQCVIISYPFGVCHLQTARNCFQFMESCFTSSVMVTELHLIMHGFFCVALKIKQEYERQGQTTFYLPKSKLLNIVALSIKDQVHLRD